MQVPQSISFVNWEFNPDDELTGEVIGNSTPYIYNLTSPIFIDYDSSSVLARCHISGLGEVSLAQQSEIASKITYEFTPSTDLLYIPEDGCSPIDVNCTEQSWDILIFTLRTKEDKGGNYQGSLKIYYEGELLLTVNNIDITIPNY